MSLFRRLCRFSLPLLTLMFAYGRTFGQGDPDEIGQVLGEAPPPTLAPGRSVSRLPDAWVNSPPKFEDFGVIETGQGYRLRKLRYEIVPGFQSVAILYEPEKPQGKLPAILNVNGHVGPLGKAIEYKQKRCINFAKHGIL